MCRYGAPVLIRNIDFQQHDMLSFELVNLKTVTTKLALSNVHGALAGLALLLGTDYGGGVRGASAAPRSSLPRRGASSRRVRGFFYADMRSILILVLLAFQRPAQRKR